jgi:hypothetical protein
VKSHIYSFSSFSRVYENIDTSEEDRLTDLYTQATEALIAELKAGTADVSSYLKWIDTVCDVVENTKMKGLIIDMARKFHQDPDNIQIMWPIWTKMGQISEKRPNSPESREIARAKRRYSALTAEANVKRDRAEELQKKYGLL